MSDPDFSSLNRLDFIDGLRGIAILGVVYHHLFSRFTSAGYQSFSWGGFELYPFTVLSNGWLGVNLFFFLSGFVLYLPYLLKKRSLHSWADTKDFYARRARRLLPLYYFNVLFCAFLFYRAYASQDFFANLALLSSFTHIFTLEQYFPKFNWVLWSLSIEVWFSVLLPIVILAIHRFGHLRVLIAVLLLSLGVRWLGMEPQFMLPGNPYLNPVKDSILGRLDDFVLGMFCCYLCIEHRASWIQGKVLALMFVGGLLLALLACHLWDGVALGSVTRDISPLINLCLSIGFFGVVIALYRGAENLRRVFSVWPLVVLGMMCYSVYVWHGVLMVGIYGPIRYSFDTLNVATYLLALIAISALSYRYIEFGHVRSSRKLFALK